MKYNESCYYDLKLPQFIMDFKEKYLQLLISRLFLLQKWIASEIMLTVIIVMGIIIIILLLDDHKSQQINDNIQEQQFQRQLRNFKRRLNQLQKKFHKIQYQNNPNQVRIYGEINETNNVQLLSQVARLYQKNDEKVSQLAELIIDTQQSSIKQIIKVKNLTKNKFKKSEISCKLPGEDSEGGKNSKISPANSKENYSVQFQLSKSIEQIKSYNKVLEKSTKKQYFQQESKTLSSKVNNEQEIQINHLSEINEIISNKQNKKISSQINIQKNQFIQEQLSVVQVFKKQKGQNYEQSIENKELIKDQIDIIDNTKKINLKKSIIKQSIQQQIAPEEQKKQHNFVLKEQDNMNFKSLKTTIKIPPPPSRVVSRKRPPPNIHK